MRLTLLSLCLHVVSACAYESAPPEPEWLTYEPTHAVQAWLNGLARANTNALECHVSEVHYTFVAQGEFDRRGLPDDRLLDGQLGVEMRKRGSRPYARVWDDPRVSPYHVWLHEAAHRGLHCAQYMMGLDYLERLDYHHKTDIWDIIHRDESKGTRYDPRY